MPQKIAVLFLHGAGTPQREFAEEMIKKLSSGFKKAVGSAELEFAPVFWSEIFAAEQNKLLQTVTADTKLDYMRLRKFVIEFLSDAVAYQPTNEVGQNYDNVHALIAKSIGQLKKKAGANAPLCVISHSLGSIVASNYFYDLQYRRGNIGKETKKYCENTPIEQCETLTLFYTMGSPMALWSLRYIDFGSPIKILDDGEWLNFYDKDDVLAFPLKGLNEAYNRAVTMDIAVNAGGLLTSWNPLSHKEYDTDAEVIEHIVKGLVKTWKKVNAVR